MDFRETLRDVRAAGKKVLIVGLGVSGIESARFLKRVGLVPLCIEKSSEQQYSRNAQYRESYKALMREGIKVQFGIDGERAATLLADVGFAVVSPGVPMESSVVGALRLRNVPIVSELELGVELSSSPCVVVTGSNGKSTTVSLLHHLLETSGLQSILCGNVGDPVVRFLESAVLEEDRAQSKRWLVVEASSYQLESCTVIKPRIGIFLNLSENHLERHGSMERYFEAKAQLFARQGPDDVAILNLDDPRVWALHARLKSRVLGFTSGRLAATGGRGAAGCGAEVAYAPTKGVDQIRVRLAAQDEVYESGSAKLMGAHNRSNMAAAILAARLVGASVEDCARGLESFKPLEHRLEVLDETRSAGPIVVNDSKSTTVASTCAAFLTIREHFPDRKVLLLIGGLAKAGSWHPLIETLVRERSMLSEVVCFGADGRLLSHHVSQAELPFRICKDLADGVESALKNADRDAIVLFSPGCASFDEFSNFEARGRAFKLICRERKAVP